MNNKPITFENPYRPGAGHSPPYLAGRKREQEEFKRLLGQNIIVENMVLTGLRGVGKTVLLDRFKRVAVEDGWLWAGTDLSEAVSVNEQTVATRLITDLSLITSGIEISRNEIQHIGFVRDSATVSNTLNYNTITRLYEQIPGLVSDKLKSILEIAWVAISKKEKRGIVFAYDEAQTLSNQEKKEQYPLSLLLDIFQSIQKKGIPFMLVLTGLPTLFPKLVEARTFSERMFRVVFLKCLDQDESRDAILLPLKDGDPKPNDQLVDTIFSLSGGYPYFIQFICREYYDRLFYEINKIVHEANKGNDPTIPTELFTTEEIIHKLDTDFFAGRWDRATDRQRELLSVAAGLANCDKEFTARELADRSRQKLDKPFSYSHVNQMISSLCNSGLIYKNRYGKYSFAVPLLWEFIRRQKIIRND